MGAQCPKQPLCEGHLSRDKHANPTGAKIENGGYLFEASGGSCWPIASLCPAWGEMRALANPQGAEG